MALFTKADWSEIKMLRLGFQIKLMSLSCGTFDILFFAARLIFKLSRCENMTIRPSDIGPSMLIFLKEKPLLEKKKKQNVLKCLASRLEGA